MRLLECDSHGTFSLTEFVGSDVPKYAILSHTWGADGDEVTFKDIIEGSGSIKVGYNKIQFCGERAKHNGIRYFWVDTCCIDKSSSAELSESINSMFHWYRNAVKCYVFLTDVSKHDKDKNDKDSQFRKSRWFTRGWTLQELIASPSVDFFSLEGERLGDKKSLERQLHEITGIAIQALRGSALAEFSVAERISWAAKRRTKREEDQAYSLLGIFNVHMPLIYGEGERNAFRRLQEEIHKSLRNDQHDDVSCLSDNGPKIIACAKSLVHPPSPCQQGEPLSIFPFARNEGIVQRDAFDQLAEKLSTSQVYQSAAIWGLGGCGKTQIALEYAYRRQLDTSCSVFWVHGVSEASFSLDYTHIAKKAGFSGELKGEELLNAVREWIEPQKNWLLVLDNVDDIGLFLKGYSQPSPDDLSAHKPELLRFVPKGTTGTVLWISRDKEIVGGLVDAERGVHVKQMTREEGLALLRRQSQSLRKGDPSEFEDKLLHQLDHLPLAIAQAAAYIKKTGDSVEEYLKKLESSENRQFRLLDKEFIDRHRRFETPNSVMQTWLISMVQVARESKDGGTILRTVAFWDHQGLPLKLLQEALGHNADEDDVSEAIARLESFLFLQRRRTESQGIQTYDMHRLVQLATRNSLDVSQREHFSGRALRIIADIFPDGFFPTWDKSKAYLSHALKATKWPEAEGYSQNAFKLLYNVSSYFYWSGRFTEAIELQLQALTMCKEMGQEEDPATLRIMSRLGATYRQLGRFQKAEEVLQQTASLQKKVMGERHSDTLTTMSFIATLYQSQHRIDEAEKIENKVLELRKAVLPEHHQDIIRSMANIATIFQIKGCYDEAERLKMQVLTLRKSSLGEEHPETLRTMNNLANSYYAQDRLEKAEELGERTLDIQKRVLGERHPDTLRSMVTLSKIYSKHARLPEAEQLELEVLKLRKGILGAAHPGTLKSRERLVTMYEKQGRFMEAIVKQTRVLDVQKDALGTEHPNIGHSEQKLQSLKDSIGHCSPSRSLD